MALIRLLLLGLLPFLCLTASPPKPSRFDQLGPRGKPTSAHRTSESGRHIRAMLQSQKVNNITSGTMSIYNETSKISNRSPREPLARYGAGIVYMLERTLLTSRIVRRQLMSLGSRSRNSRTDSLGYPRYRIVYATRGSGL